MAIKDSFTIGPRVTRQRRLTAQEKSDLRGVADEQSWSARRVASTLGDSEPLVEKPTIRHSKSAIESAVIRHRARSVLKIIGSRQSLEGGRLAIKVAYPTNLGSPDSSDVIHFIAATFPSMEIEHVADRKSGLIELVLRAVHEKEGTCDKCGELMTACNCDKTAQADGFDDQVIPVQPPSVPHQVSVDSPLEDKPATLTEALDALHEAVDDVTDLAMSPMTAQMDPANMPAGTAASPIDGQRDALSAEEVEGTGKIAQAGTKWWQNKCHFPEWVFHDKFAVDLPEIEQLVKSGQLVRVPMADESGRPADPANPKSNWLVRNDCEHLRRTAQMSPPLPAPPATPPAAPQTPSMNGPGEPPPEEDAPDSEMGLDEALEMLSEATEVVINKVQEGDALIHGQEVESVDEAPPQGAPPAGTPFAAGAPVTATRNAQQGPSDPKAPKWLNQQRLDEARAKAKQNVSRDNATETGLPAPSPDNDTSDPGAINRQSPSAQPDYGYGSAEDQEFFWLDELAGTRLNTTVVKPELGGMRNDVSRPYGYKGQDGSRTFQGIPIAHAGADGKGRNRKDNTLMSILPINIYSKVMSQSSKKREHSPYQWGNLTPEERQQAMFDMSYMNKLIRDRIRNIMTQTPDGPVKKKPGETPTIPAPPDVKKKGGIGDIVAVDPNAQKYWEDLYGEYGHQMTKDCCPEHQGVLDQRQTDMQQIAASLNVTISPELGQKLVASLRRPRCVGFFLEFAKNGFAAPPMDKMVDMAIEMSQSDASLARQLDRLTLKYLMKTSDLMNAMTPDAQRTVLIRAIRGDKRIYNSLLRLYNQAVGVNGPTTQAPMAVAAALAITAKGFSVNVHGQPSDGFKVKKDKDKADSKANKQPIPGHVRFTTEDPRLEGKYTFLDIAWDPKDCEGREEDSIRQLIISYVKGRESTKQFMDLGFLGTIHIQSVDTEAGFAVVYFRSNKSGDAVKVTETK